LNGPAVLRVAHEGETRVVPADEGASDPAVARDGVAHVDVEGQSLEFRIAPPPSVDDAARHAAGLGEGGVSMLTAPMPGRVIAVRVAEGAQVARNAVVVVMEAMKMEHTVVAPIDGCVVRVSAVEGQQVGRGDPLAEIEPYDAVDADE
jgi:biotin carboxyl carrier protein